MHLENCQYKDNINHKCPKPYVIMQAFERTATLECQVKERYCIMVGHKVFSKLNDSLILLSWNLFLVGTISVMTSGPINSDSHSCWDTHWSKVNYRHGFFRGKLAQPL